MTICISGKPAKFEDAINKTGYGRFNIYVLFIGGGCLMSVIMETMGMMFVIPAAECDLELSLGSKGLLASISFLGVVSSSHFWGFLADTRGRKNVLLASMVGGFITSNLSSIAPAAWMFILIRYVNGFFIGGSSAVVYAYVGEFHDQVYRPKVVTWMATFVALGNVMLPGLSWVILPLDFSYYMSPLDVYFRPWRLLVILIGLSSLFFAIGIYLLPESPKYLLTQGKNSEALNTLKYIYRINRGKNSEDFPVSTILWDEDNDKVNNEKTSLLKSVWIQTSPLFKTPHLPKTIMVCTLQFGAFASSSGLFMWYPDILNTMASYSNYSNNSLMCEAIDYSQNHQMSNHTVPPCTDTIDEEVYQTSIVIGACLAVLYIAAGSIINMTGAKKLLILIITFTSICGLLVQYIHGTMWAKYLMGIFLMVGVSIGIINTIVVELYPTHLRGMALAISLMAGRFGAVTGSHFTGPLIYKLCSYTFFVFAADHIVLIIIAFLLPTSAKTQKMIEPIT